MLTIGTSFPDFTLQDQNGVIHTLNDYSGNWLVVYFYPKDNTSGCSLEAGDFAAQYNRFQAMKAQVLGVSPDSVKSHDKFACKLALPFTLLSDPEHSLLTATGVWQKKKMAGREYMGVVRTTFLLEPHGIIRALWSKVKVAGHVQEVLETLKRLQARDA